jgi:hypothetical protein
MPICINPEETKFGVLLATILLIIVIDMNRITIKHIWVSPSIQNYY